MIKEFEEVIVPPHLTNYAGMRFHKLLVLYETTPKPNSVRMVVCQCDCGSQTVTRLSSLKNDHTKSCGCYHKEAPTVHGMYGTTEYSSWSSMISRCNAKPSDEKNFKNYKARGIRIYEPWINDFQAFYGYIGPKPGPEYTIDRIDNNGHYEPGNVRWATQKEQNNNRSNTLMITFKGVTKPAKFWTEYFNINYNTFYDRYSKGWSIEDALLKPVVPRRSS